MIITPNQNTPLGRDLTGGDIGLDFDLDSMTSIPSEDGGMELIETFEVPLEASHDGNLSLLLAESVKSNISSELVGLVEEDARSRQEWESAFSDSLQLLGFDRGEDYENNPVTSIAQVVHPLLAESSIKIQSKALQELFPARGPVRCLINGVVDENSMKKAWRIEKYLNYLLTTKMEEYYEESDRMLFYLALSGSAFRKIYWDDVKLRPRSLFIPAEDIIVPDFVVDIDSSPRVTQRIRLTEGQLKKYQAVGFYDPDVDLGAPYKIRDTEVEREIRKIDGRQEQSQGDQYLLYEIHCDLNLEGFEDLDEMGEPTGLGLPYIVTIESESEKVLSIRRNWEEEDPLKQKRKWFVHHKLTTGLGFYGLGMVHLIGNQCKVATQLLRDIVIASSFANFPAGFKVKGFRTAGDETPLKPGEWRDMDIGLGNQLRDCLLPLPYKGADPTLIETQRYIVDSAMKFADETGAVVEDSAGYGPVGTTMALLEASSRFYSSIHRRLHASLKRELGLLVKVLTDHLPSQYPYNVGMDPEIYNEDFDGSVDILPVSDPNISSNAQRLALAREQLTIATQFPQEVDLKKAITKFYVALGVENPEDLLKEEAPPPPPRDPVGECMALLNGEPVQAYEQQDSHSHLQVLYNFLADPRYGGNPLVKKEIGPSIQALIGQHLAFAFKKDIQLSAGQMLPGLGQPQQEMQQEQQMQLSLQENEAIAVAVADASAKLLEKDKEIEQANPLDTMAEMTTQLAAAELQERIEERKSREKLRLMDLETKRELDKAKLVMEKEELKAKMLADRLNYRINEEKLEIQHEKNKIYEKNIGRGGLQK